MFINRLRSDLLKKISLPLTVSACLAATVSGGDAPRLRLNADANWRFTTGDPADAQAPSFDDSAWRTLTVPHDWSIEGAFDPKAPMGGAGGFLPAGVGWYRRVIQVPVEWQGRRVAVEFEGVYMNADVYLNGQKLATQPYGYTTFFVDLTPALAVGKNILAVRVDNSRQKNSRWYSGSGIYRHVWLHVTNPLRVAPWGVFVSTPTADRDRATVSVQTELVNDSDREQTVSVQTVLVSPVGKQLAQLEAPVTASAGGVQKISQQTVVVRPDLWSPHNPQLSKIITRVTVSGQVVDEVTTAYGIRALAWSAERGLTISGEPVKLHGGCVHHDHGCLGAAAFDRAEERRVQQLLDAGFNAVRVAHNPPSPAFLDHCDRLGLLVMDEAFDMWDEAKLSEDYHVLFKDWWERDLTAFIKRDRNHPSVVMWSIGNEINERSRAIRLADAETAQRLADCVRALDRTRPVTEAIVARPKAGVAEEEAIFDRHCAALDITGYNYTIGKHAEDHARVPDRVMVSTESFNRDTANLYHNQLNAHTYIVGDFTWSALDYLGEAGIGRVVPDGNAGGHGEEQHWPWHGAECGDIDLTGFRRPHSHYTNIVRNAGEKLYLAVRQPVADGHQIGVGDWAVYPELASWTWPGFEEQKIQAVVYARADKVKLFQDFRDGQRIFEKRIGRDQRYRAEFDLTYRAGALRAEAWRGDEKIGEQVIITAGEAAALTLTADRQEIAADGQDLVFVTVEVTDKNGVWRPDAAPELTFTVSGAGVLQGVANGDISSLEPYQGSDQHHAWQGRALAVIRSGTQSGDIKLTVSADGFPSASVTVSARQVKRENVLP
ncbi:MAG: DUF4982 domain-containing protein [Verrucomicrobiales bacterium]|jgi:beta-galactosidase|nr:DUF4982 domain-containing protein [Verrucomicrobiales bacterium]